MNLQFSALGHITIAKPVGRLDFASAPAVQSQLEEALEGSKNECAGMIIDCAELDYVSSAGLRVFLQGLRVARKSGLKLVLCSLRPAVREVFDVSGFSQLMTIQPDRATALAHITT